MNSLDEYRAKTQREIREVLLLRRVTNEESHWQTKRNSVNIDTSSACCCVICFESDPLVLEQHHIAGKNNSAATITVCSNCHKILSTKQTSWPRNWSLQNNYDEMKFLFLFAGLIDIAELYNPRNAPIIELLLAFALHKKEGKKLNALLLVPILFGIMLATMFERSRENECN